MHTKWTARRLAADAMFAAMVTVLGLVSISTGNLKITVEALPVFLGALLLGPVDGLAIGGVGTLLYQLLRFGVSATTALWIAPYVLLGLCVGAAAYPEGHIDCLDPRENIRHLRAKQDAGADFFITQLFFNNDDFYRFREAAESAGVTAPISCGIMPFLGKSQIQRMVFLCGSSLPAPIIKLLAKYEDDPASLRQAGIEYACNQLVDLGRHGVDGLHVYAMNQPDIACAAAEAVAAAGLR